MKFDFSKNDGKWFNHFLENREVSYTALSLNEFYDKMGKIVICFVFIIYFVVALRADPEKRSKFTIPIIFIDELPKERSDQIKFFRNIVRCLVLPCVLSSTNLDIKIVVLLYEAIKQG
jgi:hypothetical protein